VSAIAEGRIGPAHQVQSRPVGISTSGGTRPESPASTRGYPDQLPDVLEQLLGADAIWPILALIPAA
jgi:hypothetical protein